MREETLLEKILIGTMFIVFFVAVCLIPDII